MNLFNLTCAVISIALFSACASSPKTSTIKAAGQTGSEEAPNFAWDPSNRPFPQECYAGERTLNVQESPACYIQDGKSVCLETMSQCACASEKTGKVASWARLRSAENGNAQYGYCKYRSPDPRQVDYVVLPQQIALPTATPPAAPAPIAVATPPVQTAATPTPDATQMLNSKAPDCVVTEHVLTCRKYSVKVGEAPTATHCVGNHFEPLVSQELAKYDGRNAPCTCKEGTLTRLSGTVAPTWTCVTGK